MTAAPILPPAPYAAPRGMGGCYACDAEASGLCERFEDGATPLYRLACERHRSHALPSAPGHEPVPLPGWVRIVREPLAYAAGVFDAPRVLDDATAAGLVAPHLAREEVEVMVVIALDGRSHVLGLQEVARGSTRGLAVSTRALFRLACALGASGIVVAHNHPSGSCEPSPEDDDMTAAASLAGDVLGIALVDHLVVSGPHDWHSYLASGRLDRLRAGG